jgi:hypothetical protein
MATNKARFKITGTLSGLSLSTAYAHYALPGETLSLQLEDPNSVTLVTYSVPTAGDLVPGDYPLSSKGAPVITVNGNQSYIVSPASGIGSIDMYSTEYDTHSWIVRAEAATDLGPQQFERKLVLSMGKPAKSIPGETTQGGLRGWQEDYSQIIADALPYYQARAQTTDATPTLLGNGFSPTWGATVYLRGVTTAQRVGTNTSFKSWSVEAAFFVDTSGTITTAYASAATVLRDLSGGAFTAGTPEIVASSGKLYPRVTGVAAQNINWVSYWDATILRK